jgi:DNA-binding HxlR family transcriptional regulator
MQLYPPQTLQESKLKLFSDAWSVKLLLRLAENRQRFTELQHALGISSKTLSNRLKRLEEEALVSRTLYAQVPLRVEYELTEKGYELKQLLDDFSQWEKKWT